MTSVTGSTFSGENSETNPGVGFGSAGGLIGPSFFLQYSALNSGKVDFLRSIPFFLALMKSFSLDNVLIELYSPSLSRSCSFVPEIGRRSLSHLFFRSSLVYLGADIEHSET